jgi:hypothetical protein
VCSILRSFAGFFAVFETSRNKSTSKMLARIIGVADAKTVIGVRREFFTPLPMTLWILAARFSVLVDPGTPGKYRHGP